MKFFHKNWQFILIFVSSAFFMFSRLGRDLLTDWDECLYGQYVKEMGLTGHFMTNIWNGYLDFQKPPLYSWLVQIPYKLFGSSEFSLRLLSVLCALGILTAVYGIASQYFSKRIALFSALILSTAEVFVIYSMKMNTDMLYVLLLICAVWAWLLSYKKSSFSYIAGLLFGLAVMAKGIGSVQFIGTLVFTLLLNPSKERFYNYVKMGLTTVAVILPWHIYMYLNYSPDFIRIYFFENILKRSKYPIEFHRERWYYYFVLLFKELRPWIFLSIVGPIIIVIKWVGFTRLGKDFRKILNQIQDDLRRNEILYTIVLLVVLPLLSITKVHTKLAWYILPIYPFLSIYLAYCLDQIIVSLGKAVKNTQTRINVKLILTIITSVFLITDAGRLYLNEVKFD
ncbi:MAG: ArnT family glycosyltransferase, partial [Candidatus Roizmanbacteria bacterium]